MKRRWCLEGFLICLLIFVLGWAETPKRWRRDFGEWELRSMNCNSPRLLFGLIQRQSQMLLGRKDCKLVASVRAGITTSPWPRGPKGRHKSWRAFSAQAINRRCYPALTDGATRIWSFGPKSSNRTSPLLSRIPHHREFQLSMSNFISITKASVSLSRRGSLPVFRIFFSSSVEISGVSWPTSLSVV